jgi:hypothetical protein
MRILATIPPPGDVMRQASKNSSGEAGQTVIQHDQQKKQ